MYALIHNSQLILGPIQYNYRMINGELEELEIEGRVTPRDYENIPIQFDEVTFLIPSSPKSLPPQVQRVPLVLTANV